MPTQKVHFHIACSLMSALDISEQDTTNYLIGASFPDCPEIDFQTRNDRTERNKRHYKIPDCVNGIVYDINGTLNIGEFLKDHTMCLPFHKGWLTHLVCDTTFNEAANRKFTRIENNKYEVVDLQGVKRSLTAEEVKDLKDREFAYWGERFQFVPLDVSNVSPYMRYHFNTVYGIKDKGIEDIITSINNVITIDPEIHKPEIFSIEEIELIVERIKQMVLYYMP